MTDRIVIRTKEEQARIDEMEAMGIDTHSQEFLAGFNYVPRKERK